MSYIQKLICISVLFLTCCATVIADTTKLHCPSVSTIMANSNFVHAKYLGDNSWRFSTNPFSDQDASWDTIFWLILPNVTLPNEALQKAENYFKNQIMLSDLMELSSSTKITCVVHTDKYAVAISSPPTSDTL